MKYRNDWYGLALAVGILLLLLALKNGSDVLTFIRQGYRAKATVVRIAEGKDSDGDASYTPVYRFYTGNGQAAFFSGDATGDRHEWQVGDETMIVYDAVFPKGARTLHSFRYFDSALVCMILALPLIILGSGYYISRWLMGPKEAYFG